MGQKMNGGTTVSATMILARMAGINVFGTGGLGGVHRGGQDSMDISADLKELGNTCVAVICSGCKSFLDIPRTLEYLETQGCGVYTFADGRTGDIDFPAFYTRDSGVKSDMVVENAEEAAAMIGRSLDTRGYLSRLRLTNLSRKHVRDGPYQKSWHFDAFWYSLCKPNTRKILHSQSAD